ncbi:DUF4954 family protein [Treponema sp.]|uniref:DUF4954 family protein n=1 Tax=Treponema sp. TaxID=166 RepID=UPI003F023C46
MLKITPASDYNDFKNINSEFIKGKRNLTPEEIIVLERNGNSSSDPSWKNIFVSSGEGKFNPFQIRQSDFSGLIILGDIYDCDISFHDLKLRTGIYSSILRNVYVGDNCVIQNVRYLDNYRIGSRVILFNIMEMSCTKHSKFGEGLLKQDEPEENRIWIGVGNENNRRAVLPFVDMIPADAFLWSRFRDDSALMRRFVELTEHGRKNSLDTYGIVEDYVVIKNSTLLKDVKVCSCAYIKGALKLKNITVLSSEDEPSQIGEGVEMVNGIMGYGSHVFYQAIAVRFVIGRNCQLKYGARLLNSVLGDNSTVSCCELLNNLIFPFHEQHHNSSFLIASTVMGQSNIASAATIGSNHNSRSPDCEMIAGRGFWPGLCTDFKFDSKFASFVLVAKGSYVNELNVIYPFSLLAPSNDDCTVHIIPAYWFLYNMFAIVRNKYKFLARDKRAVKVQHIETNPLAPDTVQEIIIATERIVELTSRYLSLPSEDCRKMTKENPQPELLQKFRQMEKSAKDAEERMKIAREYLEQNPNSKFLLTDERCQKKYGAVIYKPAQGYKEYRRVLKYFAAECLMDYVLKNKRESLCRSDFEKIAQIPLYTKWLNVGGQLIPEEKINELLCMIKSGQISSWQEVHGFYDECQRLYSDYKARYAVHTMEFLYSRKIQDFSAQDFEDFLQDVAFVALNMLESSLAIRSKDFTDYFRSITFRNEAEKDAVLGNLSDDSFLKQLKASTEEFTNSLNKLFSKIRTDS